MKDNALCLHIKVAEPGDNSLEVEPDDIVQVTDAQRGENTRNP